MLENLSAESFSKFVNRTFTIHFDPSSPSVLELIEVSRIGSSQSEAGREPFSIVFRGSPDCIWPQGIYKIDHKNFKDLHLFLVPIGPDDTGMCYEAVFN
jgi:hypothetical protein